MNGVEAVGFHIIGKAAGAANAADEHHIFGADAEFRHGPLNGLQDRIVPAARAPAHFLVSLEILDAKLGHLVHASFSPMAASISAMRKGWPEILVKEIGRANVWTPVTNAHLVG